jgi:hypothetical protein
LKASFRSSPAFNLGNNYIVLNRYLNVYTGWQVEPHQGVNRLRIGIDHVKQTFMRPNLEMFMRVLVDEGTATNREALEARRERNWADDLGARSLGRIDDAFS